VTRRTLPSLLAAGVGALVGLALLAGACGTPGPSADVASLGDGASAGSTTTTAAAPTRDPKEAALEFARCMREHGVDVPDPEFSEDGGVGISIGGENGPVDSPALESAQAACEPIMDAAVPEGERKLDPAEEARMRENALKFAQCMRDHGVDMPDPVFEGNGRVTQKLAGPQAGGPDPESPVFQDAQEACQDIMGGGGMIMKGRRGPARGQEGGQ
jgi:hypothetical protein